LVASDIDSRTPPTPALTPGRRRRRRRKQMKNES